jgi:L-iditol 2-dehydrogenase
MATVNILNNINFEFGESVSVIGDGFMSLLLISALRHYPLDKVFIFGHHEFKLDIIRSFGFEHVVNSKKQDPWQYVMDHTDGLGVNVSIEYAGNTDALRLAASITKAKVRSKLVLASAYDNSMPFTIGNYLQNRAPVIIPAYPNQSKDKFKDLSLGIWAYEKKIIEIKPLITHEFSLDSLGDAYSYITDNRDKYIKGIVRV